MLLFVFLSEVVAAKTTGLVVIVVEEGASIAGLDGQKALACFVEEKSTRRETFQRTQIRGGATETMHLMQELLRSRSRLSTDRPWFRASTIAVVGGIQCVATDTSTNSSVLQWKALLYDSLFWVH